MKIKIGSTYKETRMLIPVLAMATTYQYCYFYYIFLFPSLEKVFMLLYYVITFAMLVSYIPLALKLITAIRSKQYKELLPLLIIPVCVLVNILYAMISSGDFTILSRQYYMAAASGTNDATGYYFAQINDWFGNMSVAILLALYIRDKKEILSCAAWSSAVLAIPAVLIAVLHPSYIGIRQSQFEGTDIIFGGGIWNIGVVGFASFAWLAMALKDEASGKQKILLSICMFILLFAGLAGLSRTMILMVALSVGTYFLLRKKDRQWVRSVVILLTLVIVFCIFNSGMIFAVLKRIVTSSLKEEIRLSLWGSYLKHFGEYWLLGAPLGSVYRYFKDISFYGRYFLPHSAVLNFLVRFGLVAAVSYLVLIKNAFFSIHKNTGSHPNHRICMICGGIAYMSLAFINQTGYAESVFYVMFGLSLAYTRLENAGSLQLS